MHENKTTHPEGDQIRAAAATMAGDQLGAEISTLARRLSAGTYELLVLVGELDERGTWATWGALSCAAWLAEACDVEVSTARTQVRVARALRDHPELDEALRTGDVSYAKARVLVPHLTAESAADLVALAARTPAGALGMAIAAWSQRHEDPEAIDRRHHQERSVSWRTDPDGMVTITARLAPADAGKVCGVIDTQVTRADAPAGASLHHQRADALVAVAALLPEAFVSPLVKDMHGNPIDASPRRRHPTRRQKRVIDERSPECSHPGCRAKAFLQYDHIHPHGQGGPTVVENLRPLCGPHNRARRTESSRAGGTTR